MVFPWLGANGRFADALAEKQVAVDTYVRLNASAYSVVAPALDAAHGAALVASTELGVYAASIVLQGWTVMAWGWLGDHSPPPRTYNTTAIREAISAYDELWAGYVALPSRHPGFITSASLMNDTFW
jgi:hypothetical protein